MKISREVRVGIFSILGISILILGYNFLRGYSPLKGYNTYYAVYNNVSGIVKSTQVTINGLKVGQVEDIGMLRAGDASKIVVTLIVDQSIKLPNGTKALISSQDLLGTKMIDLQLSESSVILDNKDTLSGEIEESFSSSVSKMMSPLKDKSEQVLVTLDKVLQSMNEVFDSTGTQKLARGINDFSGTLSHLNQISARFDQLTTEEYDKLKDMFEHIEQITRNLKNNNEAIGRSLKNIARITDSVAAADLANTINHTRNVMKEFATTLEKINKGEGSLGKMANDKALYNNLTKSSAELAALLKDMQEYPGRYVSFSVFGGNKRADKADEKRDKDKGR